MPTTKHIQKAKPTKERVVEITQGTPFVSTYANNAQVQVNYFDFRISFGELSAITPNKVTITNKMQIIMTPEHAKLLSAILNANVEIYEKQFGAIRESKDL
jgi:hypothetical protein